MSQGDSRSDVDEDALEWLVTGLLQVVAQKWPTSEAEARRFLDSHGFHPSPELLTPAGSLMGGKILTPYDVEGQWYLAEDRLQAISFFLFNSRPADPEQVFVGRDLVARSFSAHLGPPNQEVGIPDPAHLMWVRDGCIISADAYTTHERLGTLQIMVERNIREPS